LKGNEDLFRRVCDNRLYAAMDTESRTSVFWRNSQEIAAWFAHEALTSGHAPTDSVSPGMEHYGLRGRKVRMLPPVAGWLLKHGTTRTYTRYDATFCCDALITPDGALHASPPGSRGDVHLRLAALVEMADRLGFPAIR
jgi:hypothetical protein